MNETTRTVSGGAVRASSVAIRERTDEIRLALPKGRIQDGVFSLLREAGIRVHGGGRDYRPAVSMDGFGVKILKPQNVVEMLHAGTRDLGFAGADWVAELGADLVELVDTKLDPVSLVAAAPTKSLVEGRLPEGRLVVASEYRRLTTDWIARRELDADFVRTYGATEVFPPEDADCIVDNTATGATLRANDLTIIDTLLRSSTRLYASRGAYENASKRAAIDRFAMLVRSVLAARERVLLELNVEADRLEELIRVLPSMREPTISALHGDRAFAVKAAVPRDGLPELIPELKRCGGTDLLVSSPSQIVP